MKKYLLAALTFIAGIVIFVLFHAVTRLEIGGIMSYVIMAVVFGLTGVVFRTVKGKEEKSVEADLPELQSERFISVDRMEVKSFTKVFEKVGPASIGVSKIAVAIHKPTRKPYDPEYAVGLRAEHFDELDTAALITQLYDQFFPHAKFTFYDLGQEKELENFGYQIKTKDGSLG